jgi:predicted anti-sigma-YlaC factor YlaD
LPELDGKGEVAVITTICSTLAKPVPGPRVRRRRHYGLVLTLAATLIAPACSPSHYVASSMGDALAGNSLVYAGDDDIELVGEATPFGLKTIETLLVEVPQHRGLLTAASRGFTQYAYVYVQLPADVIEEQDVAAAYEARERAKKLYLRARNYGLRGLGFESDEALAGLRSNPLGALSETTASDVEILYWTGVAWSAAIALGKDEPALIADLPTVDAIILRAAALNSDFDEGGLQTFLITYEMGRPNAGPEAIESANQHFQRAVKLSGGGRVAPFVAMAESVTIAQNQRQAFESLLAQALAIDPDARREWRLANHVMQRHARWLLAHSDMYFLE